LSSNETTCTPLQNFPKANLQAIGELGFDKKPLICGGESNPVSCFVYSSGDWEEVFPLKTNRIAAASLRTEKGVIVSGGFDSQVLKSQAMITLSGSELIVELPTPQTGHCLVEINSTHIISIGNKSEGSSGIYILDIAAGIWTQMPSLRIPRNYHSCGKIRISENNDEEAIIVIGGFNGSNLDSVEILRLDELRWHEGPTLPISLSEGKSVQDPRGGIIFIGGKSDLGPSSAIYKLSYATECWELLPQKLQFSRQGHIAFFINDDLVDCYSK